MNNVKYLPIGTVVMLKGGKRKIMIIGFEMSSNKDGVNKHYDYAGCIYPEGMLDYNTGLFFNHDQIEKIYYMGYKSDEHILFDKALKDYIKKENDNINQESNNEQ